MWDRDPSVELAPKQQVEGPKPLSASPEKDLVAERADRFIHYSLDSQLLEQGMTVPALDSPLKMTCIYGTSFLLSRLRGFIIQTAACVKSILIASILY